MLDSHQVKKWLVASGLLSLRASNASFGVFFVAGQQAAKQTV